ncbi:MAG: TRAP transporter TatT component family protein [Thermoanaerobaculales bacterium]|nr:TRAP transporter TatT component family protein [Thermoanaerobaculales bacterium]
MSVKGQAVGGGWIVMAVVLALSTGCSSVMSSATANLADSLTGAILNQNDPETVRQGAPAYLLLIDGLIAESPDNTNLLLAGAGLYSSYAGAFVEDRERAARLSVTGRDYGWRALCSGNRSACGSWSAPYDEFENVVSGMGTKDLRILYGAGSAWATWIMSNKSDWAAVADKARVDAMMQRVVQLDQSYDDGSAFLYLGVLATILPEAMGGKPEEGRAAFERAIELSGGRNLMAKVLLAENYAKLVFDQELYDRLCREVIDADPVAPGLTLANTLAQEKARALLGDSEDYFGD